MTKEEKIVRNLRRRWLGIIASAAVFVMCSAALAYLVSLRMKLDALITPENVRIMAMATLENPKKELPDLFYKFYKLSGWNAKLILDTMFFSFLTGISFGYIIIQIADVSTRRLFLSMWDRIQRLEEELGSIRKKTEGQQPAGCDSSNRADASSGKPQQ